MLPLANAGSLTFFKSTTVPATGAGISVTPGLGAATVSSVESASLLLPLVNCLPQVCSSSSTILACIFSSNLTLVAKIITEIASMIAGARNITSLNVVTPDAESDDAVAPAVIPAAIAVGPIIQPETAPANLSSNGRTESVNDSSRCPNFN